MIKNKAKNAYDSSAGPGINIGTTMGEIAEILPGGKSPEPGKMIEGIINSGAALLSGAGEPKQVITDIGVIGTDMAIAANLVDGLPQGKFNLRNAFIYSGEKPNPGDGSHYAIDTRLSRQALLDEDNPRTKFRQEKVANLYDYWANRRQELDEWKKSVDEYRNKKKNRMRNMLYLAGGLAAFGAISGHGATFGKGALGGKLGFWGKGGHNKRDNVPAMLMGGEYVVSADTVNRYGADFFRDLNAGKLSKFADGGMVGPEPANTAQNASDQASGAVNNVTINVNVDGNGGVTSSSSGMSSEDGKMLANLVKDQVVKTIVNEKRQGGVLYTAVN